MENRVLPLQNCLRDAIHSFHVTLFLPRYVDYFTSQRLFERWPRKLVDANRFYFSKSVTRLRTIHRQWATRYIMTHRSSRARMIMTPYLGR